jgi:hypothetical protein
MQMKDVHPLSGQKVFNATKYGFGPKMINALENAGLIPDHCVNLLTVVSDLHNYDITDERIQKVVKYLAINGIENVLIEGLIGSEIIAEYFTYINPLDQVATFYTPKSFIDLYLS